MMPTLSFFFGIYIKMYFDDHFPAHFHVEYQDSEAQIDIESGKIIEGKLPRQALNLVEKWRLLHVNELMLAWECAKNFKHPAKIPPLED